MCVCVGGGGGGGGILSLTSRRKEPVKPCIGDFFQTMIIQTIVIFVYVIVIVIACVLFCVHP